MKRKTTAKYKPKLGFFQVAVGQTLMNILAIIIIITAVISLLMITIAHI